MSGATTVCCSASRSMTPRHAWDVCGQPCSRYRGGPVPAVVTWSTRPLASTFRCSIVVMSRILAHLSARACSADAGGRSDVLVVGEDVARVQLVLQGDEPVVDVGGVLQADSRTQP